jgi:hypothetical protein
MLKSILAVIVGLFSGSIVIFLVQGLGSFFYPLSEDVDPRNVEAMKELINEMPAGALIMVLAAWAIGSFAAGFFSAMIAPKSKIKHSIITGTILLIFGIINMLTIPHPAWFVIIGVLIYIPFAYLGGKVIDKKN